MNTSQTPLPETTDDPLTPAGPDRAVTTAGIDSWAGEHPWHPRIAPWCLYLILMTLALQLRQWESWTYVPLKLIQVAAVGYLIWRWRRWVQELNWRFHRSVLPVSILLTVGWISLQGLMLRLFPGLADSGPTFFQTLHSENLTLFWLAAAVHLLAMCTAVPMVEETFNRSLLLRSLHDARGTGIGILQTLVDLPLIGDSLMRTQAGQRAAEHPAVFGKQFEQMPLGKLSWCGVAGSTAVFMLVHAAVDWPGAVLCGVTWCVMLSRTAHLGLGPIIWSHALVNLLLWIYVVTQQQWQFL